MAMTTFAEEFLLLVLSEKGHAGLNGNSDLAVAGAHLCQLAALERIDVEDRKLVLISREPTGDELLDDALARFADQVGRRAPAALRRAKKKIHEPVYERLAARELVTPRRTIFGPVHPPVDPAPADAIRDELIEVLTDRRQPDARTGTLISLLRATNTLGRALPRDHRGGLTGRELRDAGKRISEGRWASQAVARVIQDMHAATMVAAMGAGGAGS